ncbi:hypothetical protein [Mycoplasma miroungirhinis]|uniref:Uncharacterized protein n=1 Tax=Mycoplasma miroungirhinis TaxID=754516 RepID=A0A6M4JDV5_9MOLU|nr:hypothetical protein [Mycoplasma miroungirhinis]QJR44219.1 hypothetical protein HLA92_02110 [Mycoplasma miroungirhinis]
MKFNNLFKNKHATKIKKIKFWNQSFFVFSIVILVTLFFWIISFFNVIVLTTIHSYTSGALFGFNSSFFYSAIILLSVMKIFDWDGEFKFKHFFFSFKRYLIFICIVTIFGGMIYNVSYYAHVTSAGNNFPQIFNDWFIDYSTKNVSIASLPNKFTAGILSTFIFAILSSLGSQILAIIISIILFIFSIIIFFIPNEKLNLFSFFKNKRISAKSKNNNYSKFIPKNKLKVNQKNENQELWSANINVEEENWLNKLDNYEEKTASDEVNINYLDDNPFDTTEFEINNIKKKNNNAMFNDVTKEHSFIQANLIANQNNKNNNTFITSNEFENYTQNKVDNEVKKQKRFSLIKDEEDLNLDSNKGNKYGR